MALVLKESTCQCERHRRQRFYPWVGKIPWTRRRQLAPMFLPGKFHGQRSPAGSSPRGCKESDVTEHTAFPLGNRKFVFYVHRLISWLLMKILLPSLSFTWNEQDPAWWGNWTLNSDDLGLLGQSTSHFLRLTVFNLICMPECALSDGRTRDIKVWADFDPKETATKLFSGSSCCSELVHLEIHAWLTWTPVLECVRRK